MTVALALQFSARMATLGCCWQRVRSYRAVQMTDMNGKG